MAKVKPQLPPLPMRVRLSAGTTAKQVGWLWPLDNPCNEDVIVDVLPVARDDCDKPFVSLSDLLTQAKNEAATHRKRGDERAAELSDLWAQRIESFTLQFGYYREKKEEATAA